MTRKAFSLIELSIVILIIGIIIAGVTQGSRVVNQMKLATARSQTQSSPVASMQNLVLWLDTTSEASFPSTQSIEDTANVTKWNDINPQTTSKNNISRSTSNSKITYSANAGINGLPTLLIDGTSHSGNAFTGTILSSTSASFTYFVVSRVTDISTNAARVAISNAGSWNYQKDGGTNKRDYVFPGVADILGGLMTLNSEVASAVYDGTSITGYYNGVSDVTYTGTANSASGLLYIAADDGDSAWKGYIGEIIVFDRVLKTEERKAIEKYLGKKWNIRVS